MFERLRSGSVKKPGDGALFASARAISAGYLDEALLEIGALPVRSATDAQVTVGDVLVVLRGPMNAAAPVTIIPATPLFATLEVAIVRPRSGVDAEYLAWLINQPSSQAALTEMRLGGGVERLPLTAIERLPLPTPPLETQRAIAAIGHLAREQAQLTEQITSLRTIQLRTALLAVAHAHQDERSAHARG